MFKCNAESNKDSKFINSLELDLSWYWYDLKEASALVKLELFKYASASTSNPGAESDATDEPYKGVFLLVVLLK